MKGAQGRPAYPRRAYLLSKIKTNNCSIRLIPLESWTHCPRIERRMHYNRAVVRKQASEQDSYINVPSPNDPAHNNSENPS